MLDLQMLDLRSDPLPDSFCDCGSAFRIVLEHGPAESKPLPPQFHDFAGTWTRT
jgi:hypothetical protein